MSQKVLKEKTLKNNLSLSSRLAAVLVFMFLAGCGSVPVSSIYKLRNLDIKTTNLAKFYAAVRIPQSLAIREQGVKIALGFKSEAAEIKFTEHIVMQKIDGVPSQALKDAKKSGYQIYIFKLTDQDAQKMRVVRSRITRLRKEHEDGTGSLSIDVKTCKRGSIPVGPLLLSTYLRSAELDDFVVLINDADIRKLGKLEKDIEEVPIC